MDIFCITALITFGIIMIVWGLSDISKKSKNVTGIYPMTPPNRTGVADELSKFADLKERGVISEEEFSEMKEDLLERRGKMTAQPNTDWVIHLIMAIIFGSFALLLFYFTLFW